MNIFSRVSTTLLFAAIICYSNGVSKDEGAGSVFSKDSPPRNHHQAHPQHSHHKMQLHHGNLSDTLHEKHPRHPCGGRNHASSTRPCATNDTNCGEWTGRWFTPRGCGYRDITIEEARQCIGNRTIACLGDSQVRDICVGIAVFLYGVNNTVETARTGKFDYEELDEIGTKIEDYDFWHKNVPPHNHNGYTIPTARDATKYNLQFQVQLWSLYMNEFIEGQALDILKNRMVNASGNIRPIDFLLWNHGLHDYGWFDKPPYGLNFYGSVFSSYFLKYRTEAAMPLIWVSMNNQCASKLNKESFDRGQHIMVEETNKYINEKLLKDKIPYWDADAVLRVPDRCEHSADGVHVNMYVDIMRAKMFFNHICDAKNNWRGTIDQFI